MRTSKNKPTRILKLCEGISLKHLEELFIYNKANDELYEIDEKTCDFIKKCDGVEKITLNKEEADFVNYCIDEGILRELNEPYTKDTVKVYSSKLTPSLRYLELLITDKCNLGCSHCYIKKSGNTDLAVDVIQKIFNEFEDIGGLRIMISGGEPLMHKEFLYINELIRDYSFRSVLLTNGTLLNKHIMNELNFNEVQISLDGLKESHDFVRGEGNFDKALRSALYLINNGIDVSIATMILKTNFPELGELNQFINKIGVKRWDVDVPCATNGNDVFLDYESAGKYFKYGFSSGLYSSAKGYACGAHLMTVMNDGKVCKCSFFADRPVGKISKGLVNNFAKLKKIKLKELECDCKHLEECRGGCRYRALLNGGINKKDKAKCSFYS